LAALNFENVAGVALVESSKQVEKGSGKSRQ
jgi:hypothetical protein